VIGSVDIQIGSRSIGRASVDGDQVRGEGGPHDARIVLPLTVELYQQRSEAQLAITAMACSLHATGGVNPVNQIGPTVLPVGPNRLLTSSDAGIARYPVEVRLSVGAALLSRLEQQRHGSDDRSFVATLSLAPSVVWIARVGNSFTRTGAPEPNAMTHPFETGLGILSVLAPFWSVPLVALEVRVSASTWIDKVLPGLGLDRIRLIELNIPPAGGVIPISAMQAFDAARREYDLGNYHDCIRK